MFAGKTYDKEGIIRPMLECLLVVDRGNYLARGRIDFPRHRLFSGAQIKFSVLNGSLISVVLKEMKYKDGLILVAEDLKTDLDTLHLFEKDLCWGIQKI